MMLDTIEFACLCERWQKSVGIRLGSDIIGKIYTDHYVSKYEKYTLMELIYELSLEQVQFLCAWNKKDILEMIEERKIELPEKTERSGPCMWRYHAVRPQIEGYSLDAIYVYNTEFDFREGDVFKLQDGCEYKIDSLEVNDADEVCVYLVDIDSWEEICMTGADFVWMLDNCPDIAILQNIDRRHFM